MEKAAHKSNHDTGTIPCTPAGTVLHNRSDANSIVDADICAYSIVGAIGLPYNKKPPMPLGIDSGRQDSPYLVHVVRAPHITIVFCRYRHPPFLKKPT